MRRKQTNPELKAFELDTLKYITPENIKDSMKYIGICPERMAPADVTFARKSGLVDSLANELRLSKVALHYVLGAIDYREYAVLLLSKQWIKTVNVGNTPARYNEPLLPFILDQIMLRGHIEKSTFSTEIDIALSTKYTPIMLSNINSMRYVRNLLVASGLVIEDDTHYMINPVATALVQDLINNSSKLNPPTLESEFESFWNTLEHGIYDIISPQNKKLYSAFYPNLIKSP